MGDWDIYCALCAASFQHLPRLNPLGNWISILQVIGQNSEATGLSCCYISGDGRSSYYGYAVCKPSNDPNCPAPENGSHTFEISTYFNYAEMQEGAIPVHKSCLQIFKKVLAQTKGASLSQLDGIDINPDILFSTMRQKRQTQGLRCLDINYFELDEYKHEQYFDPEQSALEPFLCDPIHIPVIEDYIQAMPIARTDPDVKHTPSHIRSLHDPLSSLPPEILIEILVILPTESLKALMTASLAARQIQLTPSFWKRRVEIQMPWSWEVIARAGAAEEGKSYDWKQIHNDLYTLSKADVGDLRSFGFANRRRIYNVCQQLLPVYIQLENEAQGSSSADDDSEEMLRDAKCKHFVGILMPLTSAFSPTNTLMLPRWSDIDNETKMLELSWNSSGVLASIAITIRSVRSAVAASEVETAENFKTDTLVIQKGDWIEGFLFYMSAPETKITGVTVRTLRSPGSTFGSTSGIGRRLMSVDEGSVFVGLKAATATGAIARLGLLECPFPLNTDRPPQVNAATRKLIWKHQLPPPNVRALPFLAGYNNYGDEATECGQYMETLIFGSSDSQLDTLTGISVSANFKGLYAYHNDTEPSFIGLSNEDLKYFAIDGPGGERVVKLSLAVGSTPVGLKVLTNRGRQGIFGMLRQDSCQTHDFTAEAPNEVIAGLYGSFETFKGYLNFTSFGVLCASTTSSQSPTTSSMSPGAWDPTPPPSHWRTEGSIYGGSEHFALTYLDLTKPISKISGLLAAPDWYYIIELGGFVVTYADGTTTYVSVPTNQWEDFDGVATEVANFTNRQRYMSHGFGKADEGLVAHVTDQEASEQNHDGACWDLGAEGAQISMVTVWAGKYLNGIQFHTADGRTSPKWGKCGQNPAAFLVTDKTMPAQDLNTTIHNGVVGVKFMLDSHRDHFNAANARPVGAQALITL
ncbi:hypothetical protein EV361DRAFT_951610 [Lentinula raphanica]|uniref:F-box domain-containing protein n=1 Tax=Lentinula raphanica TaxID=153919 RepID=A0AA38P632_9AGAR|nr:hypothetical protein EV360DRAFT_73404 [Lentinula raphanica]KAJ3822139.1 hypothetical protein F5880DRAFT_719446 [Lentinula raphanica]KAJ3837003.1 hypothetical protein F5878DRAFT_662490 [Lentinula raphanica]KAJ3969275.1 hypothetical protein EV361DRAFT_951610 [Lentinula raphanica]